MRIRPQAERYNALLEERDVFDDLLLANKYFMGLKFGKELWARPRPYRRI